MQTVVSARWNRASWFVAIVGLIWAAFLADGPATMPAWGLVFVVAASRIFWLYVPVPALQASVDTGRQPRP